MHRFNVESVGTQHDVLLELTCAALQLTETQYAQAKQAYTAVGDWLDAPNSGLRALRPAIRPQGSTALGTANCPWGDIEFDVDLLCELQADPRIMRPTALYQMVLDRLSEHDGYRQKLRLRDRCIRIDYAGQFHLDVIPACPAPPASVPWGELALVIPERGRQVWASTNPGGFKHWFFSQTRRTEAGLVAASMEPMPPNFSSSEKTTLHRIVQLFKRRRDVQFNGGAFSPTSILLTTLDGIYYNGEGSLSTGITNILNALLRWTLQTSQTIPPAVMNPSNPDENLARHWREDRRHFVAFCEYVGVFAVGMQRLLAARGLENIASVLRELFDPATGTVVSRAIGAYTQQFQDRRMAQQLGLGTGGVGLVELVTTSRAPRIARTEFFGDEI